MSEVCILVVDDEPTEHEVLGSYLERAGYRVEHAYDGAEALKRLERGGVDLVCLDIRMPGMDGFEVLARIRDRYPDLPVLFLSSLDATHVKVRGLELGAEDYVVKPYKKAEVLARVRAALRRSARQRAADDSMSGRIEQVGVIEILQGLGLGGKTAVVRFDGGVGLVALDRGRLVDARWRRLAGVEAFQRLLLLVQGSFRVEFPDTPPAGDLDLGLNGALMDALVAQDEATALLEPMGGLDAPVAVSDELAGELEDWEASTTPRRMLLALGGDLRDAAARILAWWEQGLVRSA